MQPMFDLFGHEVEQTRNSKPKAQAATPRVVLKLDRRAIWGEGNDLDQLEDDETSIHTTESFTENATIERLEQALGMTPVIRNGQWQVDGHFYMYRINKPLLGERSFGKPGSILRDGQLFFIQDSARKLLDQVYNDTGSWLPRWGYWLFAYRLRKAHENEDPYELLKAFTAVMSQHDYLDASRKGDSLRRVTKRLHMQAKRAEAREQAAKVQAEAAA